MKLKTNLPKKSVELIDFVNGDGDGEAGWFIYLNPGFSFDPIANDYSCFISYDAPQEALSLCVYKVEI